MIINPMSPCITSTAECFVRGVATVGAAREDQLPSPRPAATPATQQCRGSTQGAHIDLTETFLAAARSQSKVSQCPHDLYKYPARFAPEFAREVIRAFSKPGDLVLDVFNGGGTSLIEAVALGRRAVGYDISQLACFIARTKTTPLSVHDERALIRWVEAVQLTRPSTAGAIWSAYDTEDGYYQRNLPTDAVGFFGGVIEQLALLGNTRQRNFARLILLSVGQWALDCKKETPSVGAMLREYRRLLISNLRAFRTYTWSVAKKLNVPNRRLAALRAVVLASSEHCGEDGRPPFEKAALVVTSPPYPGVHVLYHRWQILGRRETPAPFVIADCRDGDGATYYNLGHRRELGLKTYYDRLTKVFTAARSCIKDDALVVQMVAFNRPEWQLPAFLQAMEAAGYEQLMPELPHGGVGDGNLWRAVPGRKWYAVTSKHRNHAAMEAVLFHRPRAPG